MKIEGEVSLLQIHGNNVLKRKKIIIIGFESFLLLFGIFILVNRVIRGVCYTDEMWYIAEPYIVSQGGAVPYVNNWTQAAGFTIPLSIAFKIFCAVNGGTEGIVLFSRLFYVCWLVVVSLLTLVIIKKRCGGRSIPLLVIFPVLFMTPFQLYDVNYNTIGMVYLMLICALIFAGWNNKIETKTDIYMGIAAGVLMARTIIGTPNTLIAFSFILILLVMKRRRNMCMGFVIGCGLMTIAVLGYCCIWGGGVKKLIRGLSFMLSDMGYFMIEGVPIGDKRAALRGFLKPFFLCTTAAFSLKLIFLKRQEWYKHILVFLLYGLALYGIYIGWSGYPSGYARMISWSWFETIILSFFYPKDENKKYIHILSLTVITYFLVYVFVVFTNISGSSSRVFWLFVPTVITYIGLYTIYKAEVYHLYYSKVMFVIAIIILGTYMIKTSYGYVFDDEAVELLDTRIDSGIWKGLYTTKDKCEYVHTLEKEVRKMANEDRKVLFMDWSSFAYLMCEGTACAPSSYDSCVYAYNVNQPKIMYDYFLQIEDVPDDIIYIDFGKDEILSIEESSWKFNNFVLSNYSLTKTYDGGGLRILRYELNDKINGIEW